MNRIDTFKRELRGLKPGDRRLYHRGVLMIARNTDLELDQIATLLMRLYRLGYVTLYQWRDTEGVCCYWYAVLDRISKDKIAEAQRLEQ